MATRIRLQRQGRKSRPIFHIVTADSRAKRDGRYIERLGIYNPNTNPATIDLNFDRALYWVQSGAQPSDTARAILSYKGVMMKKHLLEGVRKGALTEEQAEEKYNKWLEEKEGRINAKREGLEKAADDARKKQLEAEAEVSKKRAEAIAAANAPEEPEVEASTAKPAEEEAPVKETIEDAAAAAAAEDTKKAVKEEVKTEAPKAEEKKEDTPAEEEKKESE
jgi:small subunit ribosomal protein S16